jgi:hypothetical protein
MKQVIATIGACLLLSWAGVVLAEDPHGIAGITNPTGQTGSAAGKLPGSTVTGIGCGTMPGQFGPAPGGSINGSSPFFNSGKVYAGSGVGSTNPHANSNYDVACFQQSVH